jgi:hypothetical protein
MDTLFDIQELVEVRDPNPCVALYGPGPAGMKCKSCALLLGPWGHGKKHWYKCSIRRSSVDAHRLGAASTDHRISWNACGRYAIEEPVAR